MKVFLTWRADPPDPPYWEWISNLPGIVVALSGMSPRQIDSTSIRHLRLRLGVNSTIIVDSVITPLWKEGGIDLAKPQSLLLYMERMTGADILIHKDYPLIKLNKDKREQLWRRTIVNAELALKIADKMGIKIMLVAQGWDIKSYVMSAEKYREFGAEYIAIGSLAVHRSNPQYVYDVVKAVRSAVGSRIHLHVLGVSLSSQISSLKKYADSVDISTPIRAAIAREVLWPDHDFTTLKRTRITSEIINELMSILDGKGKELIHRLMSSSNTHRFVWNLALLNAYILYYWLSKNL